MQYTLAPCKGKAAKAYVNAPLDEFSAYALLRHYSTPATALSLAGWAKLVYRARKVVYRAGNRRTPPTKAAAMATATYLANNYMLAARE